MFGRRPCRPAFGGSKLRALSIGIAVIAAEVPLWGQAATIDHLSGNIDIATVQAEVDGVSRDTVRQQHTLHWAQNVAPNMRLRLGASYFRFDVDAADSESFWREDLQPSGDLNWNHPAFLFSANARRRRSTARVSATNVTNEILGLSFRTRASRWPTFSVRFESGRDFDDDIPRRDTKDQRLDTALDYTRNSHALTYRFRDRRTENVISSVDATENRHLLRWTGRPASSRDRRFDVAWNYTYEHRRRTDRRIGRGNVLEVVPPADGLYQLDPSPELGALEIVPGLLDGDVEISTDPLIDIGGASVNQNVGVDLRIPSEVGALYVYVDRASGAGVFWDVFISDDNLSWRPPGSTAVTEFNIRSNRYEIVFGSVEARYLKAVNRGLNDVQTVYVTEIEALQEVPDIERSRVVSNRHLADLRLGYRVASNLDGAIEFDYEHVPSGLRRTSRDDFGYTITTDYRPRPTVSHSVRWQQYVQDAGAALTEQSSSVVSYNLRTAPLPALQVTASARHQRSSIDDTDRERLTSGLVRIAGNPVPTLNVGLQVNRNRAENRIESRRQDSWNYRADATGPVTRWLSLELSAGHHETRTHPDDRLLVRRTARVGGSLRVSRAVHLRGAFTTTEDRVRSTAQDYLLSWTLSRRLALSAQAISNRSGDGPRTERYGANVNYGFGTRTSVYVSYTHLDQSGAGSSPSRSFQQGIRYAL
jgi:hypothetical protein